MTTQEVKIDAVQGVLEYVSDPDRPLDERLALLCGLVKVHVAKIAGLQDDLAQEQLLNAANTTTIAWLKEAFLEARALGCKAAWALGMPGADAPESTSLEQPLAAEHHAHQSFGPDARDALAAVAALDTSGYAPQPVDAGILIEGTGIGEPPVPPRYEERPA